MISDLYYRYSSPLTFNMIEEYRDKGGNSNPFTYTRNNFGCVLSQTGILKLAKRGTARKLPKSVFNKSKLIN